MLLASFVTSLRASDKKGLIAVATCYFILWLALANI